MKLNLKLLGILAVVWALTTGQAYATAQIPDSIVIDGETHPLHTEPLMPYLLSNPLVEKSFLVWGGGCSASWRGYKATWEVVDRKLYLIRIEIGPCSDTPEVVPIDVIFQNNSKREFAEWYSGVMTIPQGKLVKPIPGGYASKYENYLTLKIKDGVVVDSERHDMAEEERREEVKWKNTLKKQIEALKQLAKDMTSGTTTQLEHGGRTKAQGEQEDRKNTQIPTELLLIGDGLTKTLTALEVGECDQAQKTLADLEPKIKNTTSSYLWNGKTLNREYLNDFFTHIMLLVYGECLAKPESEESTQARTKTKQLRTGNVPKLADYGTDMDSLHKYVSDVNDVSIEVCREAWTKNKDADTAYCLSVNETGAEIIELLREAAELGHPVAQSDLAHLLSDTKPPGSSLEIARWIKAAANSGIPHAQVTVGWWHMTGEHGFEINHAEAMSWNLKAYKQGHSEGANNIGELYEKGLGVKKDLEQAKSWWRKASVLGNAEATERLEKLEK